MCQQHVTQVTQGDQRPQGSQQAQALTGSLPLRGGSGLPPPLRRCMTALSAPAASLLLLLGPSTSRRGAVGGEQGRWAQDERETYYQSEGRPREAVACRRMTAVPATTAAAAAIQVRVRCFFKQLLL